MKNKIHLGGKKSSHIYYCDRCNIGLDDICEKCPNCDEIIKRRLSDHAIGHINQKIRQKNIKSVLFDLYWKASLIPLYVFIICPIMMIIILILTIIGANTIFTFPEELILTITFCALGTLILILYIKNKNKMELYYKKYIILLTHINIAVLLIAIFLTPVIIPLYRTKNINTTIIIYDGITNKLVGSVISIRIVKLNYDKRYENNLAITAMSTNIIKVSGYMVIPCNLIITAEGYKEKIIPVINSDDKLELYLDPV